MLRITVSKPGVPTRSATFDKREITVGRTPANDLSIPEPGVSSAHARILVTDGDITLIDLESTNGTFVNGHRIQGPHIVQPTDEVFICAHRLEFHFGSAAAQPNPPGVGYPSSEPPRPYGPPYGASMGVGGPPSHAPSPPAFASGPPSLGGPTPAPMSAAGSIGVPNPGGSPPPPMAPPSMIVNVSNPALTGVPPPLLGPGLGGPSPAGFGGPQLMVPSPAGLGGSRPKPGDLPTLPPMIGGPALGVVDAPPPNGAHGPPPPIVSPGQIRTGMTAFPPPRLDELPGFEPLVVSPPVEARSEAPPSFEVPPGFEPPPPVDTPAGMDAASTREPPPPRLDPPPTFDRPPTFEPPPRLELSSLPAFDPPPPLEAPSPAQSVAEAPPSFEPSSFDPPPMEPSSFAAPPSIEPPAIESSSFEAPPTLEPPAALDAKSGRPEPGRKPASKPEPRFAGPDAAGSRPDEPAPARFDRDDTPPRGWAAPPPEEPAPAQKRAKASPGAAFLQGVDRVATAALEAFDGLPTPHDRERLVAEIRRAIDRTGTTNVDADRLAEELVGLGPLQALLSADDVCELFIDGPSRIRVRRGQARLTEAGQRFASAVGLQTVVRRLTGAAFGPELPIVEARTADALEVQAVHPSLAPDGPLVHIARPANAPASTFETLLRNRSISPAIANLLSACVQGGLNVALCAGPGVQAHELLAALCDAASPELRHVLVRSHAEPGHLPPNVVVLQGELAQLVPAALHLRPDRLIVHGVSGPEAAEVLAAMGRGHAGTIVTLRANSVTQALDRLATWAMPRWQSGASEPALRHVAQSIELFVGAHRFADGHVRVTQLAEPRVLPDGRVDMAEILRYDAQSRQWAHTGTTPTFFGILQSRGIAVDSGMLTG